MNLTRDQLRYLARKLLRGIELPTPPYDPYADGRDFWTVYRSMCQAYEKPGFREQCDRERAEYLEAIRKATDSLAWQLEGLTGAPWRLCKHIAKQIVNEPQLPKSQTEVLGKQAGNKSRRLVKGKPCPQPKQLGKDCPVDLPVAPALPAATVQIMGARR